jgi:hypothetical protein
MPDIELFFVWTGQNDNVFLVTAGFSPAGQEYAATEEKENYGTGDCRGKGRNAMNLRRRLTLRYSGLASKCGVHYIENRQRVKKRDVYPQQRNEGLLAWWLRVCTEDLSAPMRPFSGLNIATGMNESNVLTCQRSHEIRRSIKRKKWPNQRTGSKSKGPGLGSMQRISVLGLFGRDRQMDKFLYRQKIDGFRQNNRMMVRVKGFASRGEPRK